MLQSNFIGWCHGQVLNMHNSCTEDKVAAIKTFLYMPIIRSIHLVLVATRQIYRPKNDFQTSELLTNLRGGQTLLGQLENLLFDIIRGEFQPLKFRQQQSERPRPLTLAASWEYSRWERCVCRAELTGTNPFCGENVHVKMWTHNKRLGHGQEPEVWTVQQMSDQSSKLIYRPTPNP